MKHYFFFFFFAVQMAFGQVLYPYLQNPTPNSMIVNWKTSSNNETTVTYGTSANNLNVTVTGTTNIFQIQGITTIIITTRQKLPIFSLIQNITIK
nr:MULTISPECIES: fibronectin type III domain-containing protein [unclassified Chryseobacterium]